MNLPAELREGNMQAFEHVFKTYYPRLHCYAQRFVRDADQCDDLLQDVFMRLWERREQVGDESVSALLFVMVRNACLNFLKHKALTERHAAETLARAAGSETLYQLDFTGNAEAQTLYAELQTQIDAVMRTLSDRQREVFRMSRFEGLKNREIADRLGISQKVVEKHISAALATFRKYIATHADTAFLLAMWLGAMSND